MSKKNRIKRRHQQPAVAVQADACVLCGENFDRANPMVRVGSAHVHRECGRREVMGGIGHYTDHDYWCVEVGDPDMGLSYRESAQRLDAWINEYGIDAVFDIGGCSNGTKPRI